MVDGGSWTFRLVFAGPLLFESWSVEASFAVHLRSCPTCPHFEQRLGACKVTKLDCETLCESLLSASTASRLDVSESEMRDW